MLLLLSRSRVRHLIVCNEYPPAPLGQPGGIGAYAASLSRLLAQAGETVHVIGTLWEGAPRETEEQCSGRLIVHRVPLDEALTASRRRRDVTDCAEVLEALRRSEFPPQAFAWQAALLAERLVEDEGIDVVEAQEFHAPLHYFQLRRALGLGPRARPPCIVHLHSPTELIVKHNGSDVTLPWYATARRLETSSILAADARLCASDYLRREAEALYGLEPGSISVIPYPIGDTPLLERAGRVWERGPICYLGRLELRKGVVEWLEAAVSVARERPDARFQFVGADIRLDGGVRVRQLLGRRIPRSMRRRFSFRGALGSEEVPRVLAQARLAVVPSRWDNFPNTCMEAMATGLPVIASRNGGMVEMIEDGRTGWLAHEAGSRGLEQALRRALATPPRQLAEMGAESARAIRSLCGNAEILARSLELRSALVRSAAKGARFRPVPAGASDGDGRPAADAGRSRRGIAVVIAAPGEVARLGECLDGIAQQTMTPASVCVVVDPARTDRARELLDRARVPAGLVRGAAAGSPAAAWSAGQEAVVQSGAAPLAFVFMEADDLVVPEAVATWEAALRQEPDVGAVSSWLRERSGEGRITVPSICMTTSASGLLGETGAVTAIRTSALCDADDFEGATTAAAARRALVEAACAAGWRAVTYPAVLVERRATASAPIVERNRQHRTAAPNAPLARPQDVFALAWVDQLWLIRKALRRPDRALRFLWWHARRAARRYWPRP